MSEAKSGLLATLHVAPHPTCWTGPQIGKQHRAQSPLAKGRRRPIDRAIATGGDPFDLMRAATGEGVNICVPYVQQHPFFTEKRKLFKTAEDRKRDADAAAVAAEPGPIVWVRRQFDDHRHAAYRLADVGGWHWSDISGGVQHRANRHYLHAYAWCDGMIAGELAHRCEHGPPPHRVKVCITKKGNEKFWRAIEAVAPPRLDPIYGRRR